MVMAPFCSKTFRLSTAFWLNFQIFRWALRALSSLLIDILGLYFMLHKTIPHSHCTFPFPRLWLCHSFCLECYLTSPCLGQLFTFPLVKNNLSLHSVFRITPETLFQIIALCFCVSFSLPDYKHLTGRDHPYYSLHPPAASPCSQGGTQYATG